MTCTHSFSRSDSKYINTIILVFLCCFVLGSLSGCKRNLAAEDSVIQTPPSDPSEPSTAINAVRQPEGVIDDANTAVSAQAAPQVVPPASGISLPAQDPTVTTAGHAAAETEVSLSETIDQDQLTTAVKDAGANTSPNPQVQLDEALDFCQAAQDFWQKGELENALEALDKAYSLIVSIDPAQEEAYVQQKEDLRFLIAKRILEIYASRNIVVNGNHNEIPLEMNRFIEAEIKLFTRGAEKRFFIEAYRRSGKYRPLIVKALREAGLPEELSWVPLIESGFKVKALSRARALGMWQFIPSTGYKFGLKRNQYIDERMDFIKSTQAAIAYLKELHNIFGDWATVLAAYNCGEGRVLRVIRTQNINYLDDFWDLYQRLPFETARYVPRFFATLHIVRNPEKYGLDKIPLDPSLEFEELEVSRRIHLRDISKTVGIPMKTLVELNPELRFKVLPPEKYPLRVPPGKAETVLAHLDQIPISSPPRRAFVWHRVRYGETLSTIARRYHTSVSRIMRANNLHSSHYIRAGKRLKIPQRGYVVSRQARTGPTIERGASTHLVRSGDSLWIIAKRYGTTVKAIKQVNGLRTNRLHIGQVLNIPGRKPEPDIDTSKLAVYYVKRGDSPFTISKKHNMPLERFLRINRLTPRSTIYPGQKLWVE